MAKALRTIAVIAGSVALIATGVGAVAGSATLAATLTTVASYATLAATAAGIGAQLAAKRPSARGSVNSITIATNAPTPVIIGETYFGGVLRHDVGYGGRVNKVENPYRAMAIVYSGAGPVQGLVGVYADFLPVSFSGTAATGYYAGFMYRSAQLGADPEAAALSPQWPSAPGWTSAHKLSGKAAILWSLKFDKEGKIYTSGVPQLGAVWQGVKAYDARADSTAPGGSGPQRLNDRTTWVYSENPAVIARTYLHGWWKGSRKLFGVGLAARGVDQAAFNAWANVCDANGWKVGGVIYEPDDRWANVKRIMMAGSAEPIFSGGVLSVKFDAPRVSLVTVTADDLADGPVTVQAMQSWRDRLNTIVPMYRSSAHKWEYVESDAVTSSTYLTEDGEEKADTVQFDLVQDKDQAAQLAAYRLVNGRELYPIEMNVKSSLRFYDPGDLVTIDIPEAGLTAQDCVIVSRQTDPTTLTVRWVLVSETAAKHAFALGQTGTAPPTPTLVAPEDRDEVADVNLPEGPAGAGAFTLVSVANVDIPTPTRVRSNGGTSGAWDKKARTVQGGTAASITFTPGAAQSGGGLTTDPEANASFNSVDYWLHNSTGDDNLNVWRNGLFVATIGSAGTDPLTVTSDGVTVRYYQDGIELYDHAVNAPGETVYGVLNLTGNTDEIGGVAYSVNGVAGADGADGAPGADGADGADGIDGADGADGADGIDALVVAALPATFNIALDFNFVEKAGQTPVEVQFTATLGGVDVTASATWSAATVNGCAVTNDGGGAYSVTTVSADKGDFTVTATYAGQSQSFKVPFTRGKDGDPAITLRDDTLTNTTSGTFVVVSDVLTINVPAGAVISFGVSEGYTINGTPADGSQGRKRARFMYRNLTDGGSWTQAGSDVTGSYAEADYFVFPTEPNHQDGEISGSYNGLTPPSSPKVYEARLEMLRDGVALDAFGGVFTVALS